MLKRYIRNYLRDINDGPAAPPVQPSTRPEKAAQPRTPSEAELKTEFKSGNLSDLGIEDHSVPEKEPEVKKEPVVVQKEVPIVPPVAKKEEPKKEPEVKAEPVAAVEKPKFDTTGAIIPPSQVSKERDYTGFSADETKALKMMPNEAFNLASKVIKENKELSKFKDSNFLQHPNAFMLDPQYQQLQRSTSFMEREATFWEQQLMKALNGEEWCALLEWNNDGSAKLSEPQKPTPISIENIREARGICVNGSNQNKQQLQEFGKNYQQRVQIDNAAAQKVMSERFGWVANPELMKEKINIPEIGDKTLEDVGNDFLQLIPPYQRNTLGIDIAKNMWIALQIYGHQIRELQSGKQIAEFKKEEVLRAEPSSANRPAAPKSVNGITTFSLPNDLGIPE